MARKPSIDRLLPALLRLLRVFWPWMRRERPQIAVTLGALFVGVVASLLEPWPLKFVIDVVLADDPTALPAWLAGHDRGTVLVVLALSVVAISAVVATCEYHQKVGFARIGNRVLRDVRDHVFLHMQRLSMSFHTGSRSGDLVIRATRDVSLLRDVMSTALLPLCASLLVLCGMVVVMACIEWRLTAIALATLPLFFWVTSALGRRIHRAAKKQRQREGAMASTASESIGAIKVVQALSLEGVFAEGFAGRNRASQKEDMKGARLSANLGRTVDVLLALATALVMFFGARMVLDGGLELSLLVVFLTYLRRSFRPAKDLAKYTGRIAKAVAAGERVVAILERTPDVQDLPDAVDAARFAGHVEFRDVDFAYESNAPVLRDVALGIRAGQTVAIVGPSGIGKSTLTSLLLRLYDPSAGAVCIDGTDIRGFTLRSLRRQISVVLQDTVLFAGTLRENIAHGVEGADDAAIEAAARLASAHDFITALPDGYETRVGERGATLSHGQRQRIAIARAAMRDTPILVLDEPTTGLDDETRSAVVRSLRSLARGRTTFLITHELAMTTDADVVVCIEDGRIVEHGAPAELRAARGRYHRLCEASGWREDRNAS